VIALYDGSQHHSHAFLYGNDPGVVGFSYTGWTLCYLGYPDRAIDRVHEAVALAEELSHPFSLALALCHVASLHFFRREPQPTQEWAEKTMRLCQEQGFPFWLAMATMLRGWAVTQQGQVEEGIGQIRQGLAAYRKMGTELGRPHFIARLAEVYGQVGQAQEGLSVLAEAVAIAEKNDNHQYEAADIYHAKGTLLLALGPEHEAQAEHAFQQALELACRQGAKFSELQTAVSLSRVWLHNGKPEAARHLLGDLYSWFTEGFETPLLQDARSLLNELQV
jgi:predicted ATPase